VSAVGVSATAVSRGSQNSVCTLVLDQRGWVGSPEASCWLQHAQ
jgi:hypothetical protein